VSPIFYSLFANARGGAAVIRARGQCERVI
jgi:hypothetical protein